DHTTSPVGATGLAAQGNQAEGPVTNGGSSNVATVSYNMGDGSVASTGLKNLQDVHSGQTATSLSAEEITERLRRQGAMPRVLSKSQYKHHHVNPSSTSSSSGRGMERSGLTAASYTQGLESLIELPEQERQ
ncbi:hypothetical protein ElyMa_004828600, partial [Elysia marginata]